MSIFKRPAPDLPGLVTAGHAPKKKGNAVSLPIYEFKPPAPGKLDINTLDGWNALAEIQREKNRAAGYED